ncbi:response regulator transcription factor [Paraglaciecola sp. L3A3]|uniref:response regulator n=1 Tax=Paraglaciecola sp. L3A3 TaxID=2686358 RepID=UPI00131BFE23|nr:response regulator transcription factor [Paraglaciecola sp. L3A3]
MTIRVLLVEDQNLVRLGICSLLELTDDITVVAQLSDGCDVNSVCTQYHPDIILLDIRMPKTNGLSVLSNMASADIACPVLVLTTFDEHDLVLKCMKLGAKGYLRKDVSLESLISAIRCIINGELWIQPAITEQVQNHDLIAGVNVVNQLFETLTSKETQILRLIAAGYSNNEIAGALHNSDGTIRNTVSTILAKLNVRDRTRAVITAMEHSLI